MSMLGQRSLLLAEQVLSSVFNFLIVVVLSRTSQEQVASFGLIYSFALVYSAFIKNGALNIYLTSGVNSLQTLHKLVVQVLLNRVSVFVFAAVLVFIFFEVGIPFLFLFIYYALADIYKTYLFSAEKFLENMLATCLLIIVFFAMYYTGMNPVNAFAVVATLLIFRYFNSLNSDQGVAVQLSAEKIGRDSLLMTLSYTSYAHGPLWLLYVLDASLAAIFVQIRNLFQPAQILSRVIDIFEKKYSAAAKNYYDNFRRVFLINTLALTAVTAVLGLLGYFGFEVIYGERPAAIGILLFFYALICIGTFASKPIETFFYGTKRIDLLLRTRIIGVALFIISSPFLLGLSSNYYLISMLAGLSLIWLVMNSLNLIQVESLKNE